MAKKSKPTGHVEVTALVYKFVCELSVNGVKEFTAGEAVSKVNATCTEVDHALGTDGLGIPFSVRQRTRFYAVPKSVSVPTLREIPARTMLDHMRGESWRNLPGRDERVE